MSKSKSIASTRFSLSKGLKKSAKYCNHGRELCRVLPLLSSSCQQQSFWSLEFCLLQNVMWLRSDRLQPLQIAFSRLVRRRSRSSPSFYGRGAHFFLALNNIHQHPLVASLPQLHPLARPLLPSCRKFLEAQTSVSN